MTGYAITPNARRPLACVSYDNSGDELPFFPAGAWYALGLTLGQTFSNDSQLTPTVATCSVDIPAGSYVARFHTSVSQSNVQLDTDFMAQLALFTTGDVFSQALEQSISGVTSHSATFRGGVRFDLAGEAVFTVATASRVRIRLFGASAAANVELAISSLTLVVERLP